MPGDVDAGERKELILVRIELILELVDLSGVRHGNISTSTKMVRDE